MEILAALKDTPIPNILILGGIAFLLLAIAGQVAGKIEVPPARQKWAGLIGSLLLVTGLVLYVAPTSARLAPELSNPVLAPTEPSVGTLPTSTRTSPATPAAFAQTVSPAPQSTAAILSDDCFEQYFSGIPTDRVKAIEVGTTDFEVIRPDQPKNGLIGLRITEFNQPISAMRFHFIAGSDVFRIETVTDSRCQIIEDYFNESRGGDKRLLQNWDTLRVQAEDQQYTVRLGYSGGEIRAGTQQLSP